MDKKGHRVFIPMSFLVFVSVQKQLSYYSNVGCTNLAAVLRIRLGIKSNLLALFQGLKALGIDSGEMYEYFFAGRIVSDETITLLRIKPFHCTVIHFGTSFDKNSDSKT